MIFAGIFIVAVLLLIALVLFWPMAKCPRCGARMNMPTEIPGVVDCMKCGRRFDSWQK